MDFFLASIERCLTYFRTDPSDQPTDEELSRAETNAMGLIIRLRTCQNHMREQFPHHTHAIRAVRLIDEVRQALRDDNNGVFPDELLTLWCEKRDYFRDKDIFAAPEEKEAMRKVWNRWNNRDELHKQFWALNLDGSSNDFMSVYPVAEERILQVERCLTEWLKNHKNGQLY